LGERCSSLYISSKSYRIEKIILSISFRARYAKDVSLHVDVPISGGAGLCSSAYLAAYRGNCPVSWARTLAEE
jgi:hypothetical protein